jgi:hypothetical protein
MDRIENDASNSSSILQCVFVAAVTFLPSPCLATVRMHIQTHRLMGGIYEVCHLDGVRWQDIHTRFNNNWFRHSKVDKVGYTVSLLLFFFQNKESRLESTKHYGAFG